MTLQNTFTIDVELKKSNYTPERKITRNDDVTFLINILDDGVPFDLSEVTTITLANTRLDSVTVVTPGVKIGANQVSFALGSNETDVTGRVNAIVRLYDAVGRVSTLAFNYSVIKDPTGGGYIPPDADKTLIQIVLGDGPLILQNAITATTDAINKTAETEAVRVATEVERIAIRDQQGAFESTINNRVTDFESTVNTRVIATEAKSVSAETIAKEAKARADLIIGQTGSPNTEILDSRLGADLVPRATSGELIREIHANQLESARQTTTLSTGVSVVSGGVDALAETEIEGRTLISLGNSNLEALKQYVVADKKTKVVTDGVTYSGVAKFTKGTTTVSTANFVGKVTGSNVVNPHVAKFLGTNNAITAPSSGTWSEVNASGTAYNALNTLSGTLYTQGVSPSSGQISQTLFSFDIIAEIERKLGIIPKTTLAEKVQWVKDNAESVVGSWHGFGSSVGGNKASFSGWNVSANLWDGSVVHTSGSVANIAYPMTTATIPNMIDVNGFIHFLAYAEPSNGTIASSVSTDYITCVITLKATAQLNTRPTIIRVENFEGKVAGSVVENAHVAKRMTSGGSSTTLQVPSSVAFNAEITNVNIEKLDGILYGGTNGSLGNGYIAQQLFSFDLIQAVERNVGRIPRATVVDKVQWLKDSLKIISVKWHGFGSSVGGNKATLSIFNPTNTTWIAPISHTLGTVSALSKGQDFELFPGDKIVIDANGFVHYLAYAEPSDGVIPSTINTDYIDFEMYLKPTADFTRPKVALYEVALENYPKILVDWSADEVVNRYPIVEGVQHLQGVGVVAEGENLLPPFSEWTLHANTRVISSYELELNATSTNQGTPVTVPATPSAIYTLSGGMVGGIAGYHIEFLRSDLSSIKFEAFVALLKTFTTTSDTKFIRIIATNGTGTAVGKLTFTNPMLTLGNAPKPFVPRNPSYLYADVKLGAIGTARDTLYEQDGAKFVRKAIEKDVVLGGDFAWNSSAQDNVGSKRFLGTFAESFNNAPTKGLVTKYNGLLVKYASPADLVAGVGVDVFGTATGAGFRIDVVVADTDTGFGETFNPSIAEQKAYFYGWKMNNGTYGTNYESTGTKTWIPIGDLNNARAVTVVPTSASPTQLDGTIQPYKLSYVLATPQIVNVTDKIEGQLKVNGLTQVEVLAGVIRREKVVPKINVPTSQTVINDGGATFETTRLKNKTLKILGVFKNGQLEKQWIPTKDVSAYGVERAILSPADKALFDPTATYEVTYIALDKPALTANPTNVKLLYANNMRSALEDAVGKVQDNATMLSVHEKAIIDLYVRVKALGG